ncbi:MAG: response regulator [Rhodospirillales bacterium]|nr:response regulator [Rhodospirillales bacterium]MCW8861604.1 response regulator [Rhodospirillales bacterium]MCW8952315.1 response regulator [Rhodospirillales bacterium]MCW9003113.1 response regulator [Rhodospirillales bacterium]
MVDLKELSVLLVHGNREMRSGIKWMLYRMGIHAITEVTDSKAGYQRLYDSSFDLIICDENLAPMEGTDFVKHLRRDRENPARRVPAILLVPRPSRDAVFDARDAGVHEVLAEPLSAKALHDHICWLFDHPRPFVEADSFIGPDRRRHTDGYGGPERREENVGGAMKPETSGEPDGKQETVEHETVGKD